MKIEIEKLNFAYVKDKPVINNVNLTIDSKNTVAIVGPSGCGKSTLLRLISSLLPNGNRYEYNGLITIDGKSAKEYAKLGQTGFMFQDSSFSLFPNLTVRENVLLPLKIRQIKTFGEADKLIELVGLKDVENVLPAKLSGGQKTRVSLARTFVTNPNLLLLDEPFSALDEYRKYVLYNELEKLRTEYRPLVIIVTHDIREALLLSNQIIVFGMEGLILKEILIKEKLPRAQNFKLINNVHKEYEEIQDLIMNSHLMEKI